MGRQPPGTKYPYLLRNSLALPLNASVTRVSDDVSQLDPEVTGSLDPADRRSKLLCNVSVFANTFTFSNGATAPGYEVPLSHAELSVAVPLTVFVTRIFDDFSQLDPDVLD
jgi:hypothetical protein